MSRTITTNEEAAKVNMSQPTAATAAAAAAELAVGPPAATAATEGAQAGRAQEQEATDRTTADVSM